MACTGLYDKCCVCKHACLCLSDRTGKYFEPAGSMIIIRRISENDFSSNRNDMIKYLKERYGVDYISYTKNKEREENEMLHKVTVTKTDEKVLEEYWLMRAIRRNLATNAKSVIKESECDKQPTLNEIAAFLENSGGDFVSVEHNYRFEPDLPFC